MGASQQSEEMNYIHYKEFPTMKVTAVEENLTQAVLKFRNLVLELEQLHIDNGNYKKMFYEQKEKLERQTCTSCNNFKKVIATKEQILDSIAFMLNKLNETRDFSLIEGILKQIYGDTNILTPPEIVSPQKQDDLKKFKKEKNSESPQKDLESQDESVSEIEGTPTGRKSPIFQSKKTKTNSVCYKDKKKCSNSWPTSENKSIKLTYPSPTQSKSGVRMRQGRLSFVKMKSCNVVDLTCSPESSREVNHNENNIQCNIKKEIDNDETILPSPTSGPANILPLYKSVASDSPSKFRKPSVASKFKIEAETSDQVVDEKLTVKENVKPVEDSISLLNQFSNRINSPKKIGKIEDETHCGDDSISLLQHNMQKVNTKQNNGWSKRPLAENVNITNTQNHENGTIMSKLQRDSGTSTAVLNDDVVKRVRTVMAPVYKEPTVRKKAEKRALPGWSCDECKIFYDELYKDDPEMLAQKMDECSKHRGRTNPVRPKTPEGFWNPRWDVPQDTEEFNRRNNAI